MAAELRGGRVAPAGPGLVDPGGESLLVAGVMSGTSVDGIDVALVRLSGGGYSLSLDMVGSREIGFPAGLRDEILAVSRDAVPAARISQLDFLLGRVFGEAVIDACAHCGVRPHDLDLVGSHGQTIHHQAEPAPLCGLPVRSTLQIGSAAALARAVGAPVVSDFRSADVAAAGHGAPLVPFFDYVFLRDPEVNRVALNIGGIANLTAIPAGAGPESVLAFDTGPGNMVVDQLVESFTRGAERFDRDGRRAARATPDGEILKELLDDPYYEQPPPKSTGRERYGAEFVRNLLDRPLEPDIAVATAAELTARTILRAIERFVLPRMPVDELVVAGGGWKNPSIMGPIRRGLPRTRVRSTDDFGVSSDAKEAAAFAVLAYETFHGRPSNIPSATGAQGRVVLGSVTPPPDPGASGLPAAARAGSPR